MAAQATELSPFETEFARAWDTPGHTRYQLPDLDVNKVLAARYTTGKPLTVTRGMLWDMEVRKAAHPGTYIPFVVRAGSDRSWNRYDGDGGEYLDRCSMQRLWLRPERYELILERAFLNHHQQKVTFLGVPELAGADGTLLRAGTGQPLFHVEHSVGGTELHPLPLAYRPPHRRPRPAADGGVPAHGHQPLAGRAHRDLHSRQPRHRTRQKYS
jgi:hypothetical protein